MLLKAIRSSSLSSSVRSVVFASLSCLLLVSGSATAQTAVVSAVPDRLVTRIDESARVTLGGTVHPLATKANDQGAAPDGMKLDRLEVVLKRSDAQESQLKQLITAMHTPGSASYHQWLTPDAFGKQFGPSDGDVAKIEGWLQSHGFSITKLNAGRQTLEFAGTAGQFRDTFGAAIHSYKVSSTVKGVAGLETRFANASDPRIPAALAPVFGGFASLNNFPLRSYSHRLGEASFNPKTHESKPEWTIGSATNFDLVLAPQDFAVQYDLPSQATAGTNDGSGQSIAIVNESNINITLVNEFRALFGLPANPPQVIIDGNDPGIDGINNPYGENGASVEAYLDVEWAGAVAPGAVVNLVIGGDTALGDGLGFAAQRAVYSNVSPIISLSFGNCEVGLGSGNAFFSGLWEQAAAQGITVLVSTGDSGSAGCDDPDSQPYALDGQAVNGIASTPYDVAVGGTDFYYTNYAGTTAALDAELATYWNLTPSNQVPVVSLMTPVPEQPWNDSQYGFDVVNYFVSTGNSTISGGSGGMSSCASGVEDSSGDYTSCTAGYPKPSWQKGAGVPSDTVRDLPDVSLFASAGANKTYYPICAIDADCVPATGTNPVQISGVGGTSASTPSFAGIMALVNQQYGRQGQANYVLYPLATQFPAAFHDVTIGTNTVPCNLDTVEDTDSGQTYDASPNCQTVPNAITAGNDEFSSSAEGEIGLTAGNAAYNAGTGYDLATGLGTVDAKVLLADWNKVTFGATGVTLAASSTSFAHGTPVTISGTVTGTPTPTGDVALMTSSTEVSQQSIEYFNLASGAYTGSVNTLPGGTYNIWGNYGGDGSNAASSSEANAVSITVTPESSTTTLGVYVGSDNSYASTAAANNGSYMYGTQLVLDAYPSASSGTTTTAPTGSIVFTDGGAKIDTTVLNVVADAQYYTAFAPGSHTIKASYSGDNSYAASASTTSAFTVTADTPTFIGPTYSNSVSNGLSAGQQTIIVAVADADASGNPIVSNNAVAPAGTLTMTGAPTGSTGSVTLVPEVDPFYGSTQGIGTFVIPAGVTGNYNLTFTYTPSNPTYYAGISGTVDGVPFLAPTTSAQVTSTTAATATPSATSPVSLVSVTSVITGQSSKPAPTGTITIYTSDVSYGTFPLPSATGDSVTTTLLFDTDGLIQGTNQLTVQYSGDSNYLPSAGLVTVANPLNDFQMVPLTTILTVPPTGTVTDTIELTSTNSFAGGVNLSCTGATGVTCSLSPASATLTAGQQTEATLTVIYAGPASTTPLNVVVTGTDAATGNFVHTLGLQLIVPQAVAAQPGVAVSGTAVTIASQGAAGTSTITVTPTNGFTGAVNLTCAITASPTGAIDVPTCALSPASVTLGAAMTSTLTVSTTAPTTSSELMPMKTIFPIFPVGGGAALAALFFLGGPIGRRRKMALKSIRTMRILSAAMLFALLAGAAMGCGGSSSSGGSTGGSGGTSSGGTTTGAYTVTVTATPATGTAVTAAVSVTVN